MQVTDCNYRLCLNYAKGLYKAAKTAGLLSVVAGDIKKIKEILKIGQFRNTIGSRVVKYSDQIELIKEITKKYHIDNIVLKFLKLVAQAGRGQYLLDICTAYDRLARDMENIVQVFVVSSKKLTNTQKSELKKKIIKNLSHEKIEIDYKIDPSLLGGVTITYGSFMEDYSVAGVIDNIKNITRAPHRN